MKKLYLGPSTDLRKKIKRKIWAFEMICWSYIMLIKSHATLNFVSLGFFASPNIISY